MSDGERPFQGKIGRTFRDSEPWWPPELRAAPGAPNILVIVLDDVGFADLGCYGSEIATPAMDALAAGGLRYANFNVTSMCSPTRAALLSGRNPHSIGMGIIAEWSSGYPGYRGSISDNAAILPEVLRDHGYGTHAVGKWHLTNIADYGPAGPHDQWPLGRGFNTWYGFHGALADQWNPELYRDNHPIDLVPPAGYHLSADLVDRSIADIRDHLCAKPEMPFFQYLALGACHWPHHVPPEYIARQRGRYDAGWQAVRVARLAKQKALGLVPADTELAPLNPGVTPWEALSDTQRAVYARLQETYAAFLEHTDAEIGRLIDFLRRIGRLDDTLVILLSDNGASAEGGPTGAINLRKHMVFELDTPEGMLPRLDQVGGAQAFNHYPTGWAQASNTPLKWYKKDTHGGGVRAPLILHWPARLTRSPGEIRHQYHHVSDIAPTVYEALGIVPPTQYRGRAQLPIQGTSMAYTFDGVAAPTRKGHQLYELLGNRAFWEDGWKAVAHHTKGEDFAADRWELYHLDRDFAEIQDLAGAEPDRLKALVGKWWEEAARTSVLPLDDRDWERAAARIRMNPVSRYVYFGGTARVDRLCAPDITKRSYRIVARFRPAEGVAGGVTEGVLIAWGSRFAGFVLFVRGGVLHYSYVYSEIVHHDLTTPLDPPPGAETVVALDFVAGEGSSGTAILSVDGQERGRIAVPKTWPTHGTTAGIHCGRDAGAPVSDAYARPFRFTGCDLEIIVDLEPAGTGSAAGLYETVLREQ